VDCGLIMEKAGGSLQSGRDFPARDLFSDRKSSGPGARRVDRAARIESMVDRGGADKRA
jgi:hypothetical protein